MPKVKKQTKMEAQIAIYYQLSELYEETKAINIKLAERNQFLKNRCIEDSMLLSLVYLELSRLPLLAAISNPPIVKLLQEIINFRQKPLVDEKDD